MSVQTPKQYDPSELPVEADLLNGTPIKAAVNIESIVFRQIERTFLSAIQDEALFAANVRLLLSTVPDDKRAEIVERRDEYTSVVQSYQYKYWCGVPLGTPEEQVDGSPALIEEEVTDWHMLLEIILASLEESGVTWKHESWTIEAGKVDKAESPVPTPVFESSFKPKTEKAAEAATNNPAQAPAKYARPCAICGSHVQPSTGQFYLHKLVHKKDCLDLAKAKWADQPPE